MGPKSMALRLRIRERLANGDTPRQVAEALEINDRTVRKHAAALRQDLREIADERLVALNRRSLDAATEALATLREVMNDPEAAGMVRVNAAGRVLEISIRLHDAA